jgi:uncharacterized phage protein gp47/JayE
VTTYIVPPIETNPDDLAQDAFDYLEANLPGWRASPGNLDALIVEAFAQAAAEQGDVASAVMTGVFRYFGPLVGVTPIDAVPAMATATFTAVDAAGYTVDAGSVVGLRDADGNLQGFELVADVVIAAGATTGSGTVDAQDPGAAANGLSGVAELVSVPPFVTACTVGAASGGTDAEDDDVYLDRLAATLQLLAPRPILPNDFAVLARSVAGVYRAAAVDGLKPGPPWDATAEATGQDRTITVAPVDVSGASVGSAIRGNVDTFLQGLREQNFQVFVVDPNYTTIDITATVQAWPGQDVSVVQSAVIAALTDYLDPSKFGAGQGNDTTQWLNDPVIRQGELFEVLNSVDGVRYVSALTFRASGGTMGTADVTLGPGSALPALPHAGVLTVTVTPG